MPRPTSCLTLLFALLQPSIARLPLPLVDDSFASGGNPYTFTWSSIQSSRDLDYHDCYEKFKCARLIVPLDWRDPNSKKNASIAIVKLPAKVPITDSTYAGPILTNPGGPGGSGIGLVTSNGEFLQWAIDSKSKHFDIIGFDPRGVGETLPFADCFPDPLSRDLWHMKTDDEALLDQGDRVLTMKWASIHALGEACAAEDTNKALKHVGTSAVARDMLEMIEKMEENRKRELTSLTFDFGDERQQSPLLDNEDSDVSKVKLQYIGFSYGTMLGNTFASLFPDRVGRLVLDGVVDAPDYMAQGWKKNLLDTEKILSAMYKYCFEAGSSGCPIYDSRGAKAIEDGVKQQLEEIRRRPIPVADHGGKGLPPTIITYDELKRFLFTTLYAPAAGFPGFTNFLANIRKGNYKLALLMNYAKSSVHCPPSKRPVVGEAAESIFCGDGDDMSNQTRSEFEQHLEFLESQSPTAAGIWAEINLFCTGWRRRSSWRFTGPFGGNTSTPILWIGNTADPVTPLRNAYKMSEGYPGSAVLHHDSEGHCSLFNGPSKCTLGVIKEYFDSGKLPKNGTKCPAATRAFDSEGSADAELFDGRYGGRLVPPAWKMPSFGN